MPKGSVASMVPTGLSLYWKRIGLCLSVGLPLDYVSLLVSPYVSVGCTLGLCLSVGFNLGLCLSVGFTLGLCLSVGFTLGLYLSVGFNLGLCLYPGGAPY